MLLRELKEYPLTFTGKDKFAWFTMHAEAESGVVQRFKIQGSILPGAPTTQSGTGCVTIAIVRARSKPTINIVDDVRRRGIDWNILS